MADTLMIGIRFALFADLMLIMGLAAFPLHAFRGTGGDETSIAAELAAAQPWLCAVGLFVSLAGMLALAAAMQGIAVGDVTPEILGPMIAETMTGKAWIVRMLALAAALAAACLRNRYPAAAGVVLPLAATIALATLVWSGHAAAGEGVAGAIHIAADVLHMVAAGLWIGAIAAFLILLRPVTGDVCPARLEQVARGLDRFAPVGTACVVVIVVTGVINFGMIAGLEQAGRVFVSPYGYLLIAKLLLFAAMLGLAALNRWRFTPALAATGGDASLATMRRSLALESGAAAGILALVAILGMIEP